MAWFEDGRCQDVLVAGGKGSALARLARAGLPVPEGFVIASDCLARTVPEARLRAALAEAGSGDFRRSAVTVQALVLDSPLESGLETEIVDAYGRLGGRAVAVRSSACAEDSGAASFAGQQETYLNVKGSAAVVEAVRRCWASFFSERALFYRSRKGSVDDLRMAVVVQRQLLPEKSGVLFTVDPVQRRRDQMLIEAVWGLGEAVVSGRVTPDHYVVGRQGALKRVQVSVQPLAIVAVEDGGTVERELTADEGGARVLADADLAEIAAMGARLEELFGAPQDVEWAIAGGCLYLLQSRPVTA